MANVLCTGVDTALMATRKFILEREGHSVITAKDEREVTAACEQLQFDVAVIGQTTSSRMKKRIASLVREQCTGVRILELFAPHVGKGVDDADAWLEVPADVPQDLAERVNELAKRARRKEA